MDTFRVKEVSEVTSTFIEEAKVKVDPPSPVNVNLDASISKPLELLKNPVPVTTSAPEEASYVAEVMVGMTASLVSVSLAA